VLDAVGNGTVEMGHTAALYWQGKMPAASIFTTVPFGLGPVEHQAWIELRDGQALWDDLYRPFGVRGVMAGNTGPSMGGWFKRRLSGPEDLRGLRIRIQGLGAELFRRLGATPLAISAGDLLPALETGAIDAAEFLAPATDLETGLPAHAPYYYAPGFNKPNGRERVPYRAARLGRNCRRPARRGDRSQPGGAHPGGLPTRMSANAAALTEIMGRYPVTLEAFPARADRSGAEDRGRDDGRDRRVVGRSRGKIVASYQARAIALRVWSALSADMARAVARA
jgi:hypothetical protein